MGEVFCSYRKDSGGMTKKKPRIDSSIFGSDGDPDHHNPAYRFSPQDDITPREAALCAMAVSRMECGPNYNDFSDFLEELGIIRHFIRVDR